MTTETVSDFINYDAVKLFSELRARKLYKEYPPNA